MKGKRNRKVIKSRAIKVVSSELRIDAAHRPKKILSLFVAAKALSLIKRKAEHRFMLHREDISRLHHRTDFARRSRPQCRLPAVTASQKWDYVYCDVHV